jgi:hypothetical protein
MADKACPVDQEPASSSHHGEPAARGVTPAALLVHATEAPESISPAGRS